MEFKCLFCQEEIRDGELMCRSSCEHLIHEWCIEPMKGSGEHHCRNCRKLIAVYSQFVEFDLSKAVTITGTNLIVKKLDEIIKLMASRDEKLTELTNKFQDISNKVEGLAFEQRSVHFERNIIGLRLSKFEGNELD